MGTEGTNDQKTQGNAQGGAPAGDPQPTISAAQAMYPNMNKDAGKEPPAAAPAAKAADPAKPADPAKAGDPPAKDPAKPDGSDPAKPADPAAAAGDEKSKAGDVKPGDDKGDKKGDQPTGVTELKTEDLKMPDGASFDAAHIDEILKFANENKLSKEAAQKILERDASNVANARKAGAEEEQRRSQDRVEIVKEEWFNRAKSDPEFGGDKFEANTEKVFRLVEHAFGPEGKKLLDTTGLGNNPGVLKGLLKIADLHFGNDTIVNGSRTGEGKVLSDKEVMYPEMVNPQAQQN